MPKDISHTLSLRLFIAVIAVCLIASTSIRAADDSAGGPLTAANLDGGALAQWADGRESPANLPPNDTAKGLAIVVWTEKSGPIHTGITFGDSSQIGLRHLRIGFREPVQVGSILVRGGGKLSVLKATSRYPGDLSKDEDWLTAERLENAGVSQREVGRDEYALWVLP